MGVANDNLSEHLQGKANLKLQEAMQLSRQAEARKESQPLIRESRSSAANDADFIKEKPCTHKANQHRHEMNASSNHHNPKVHKKCMYLRWMPSKISNLQGMLKAGSLYSSVQII